MIKKIYFWIHAKTSRPDERGEYSSGLWQDMVRKQAIDWCRTTKGRLLEVGCGEGLFLGQAAEANPQIELWGVDNSSARIEQANKRLAGKNAHLSVEDAANLPFSDGFFDKVICINVFFNMPTMDIVKKALLQMKRVSRNDAGLIFDFRNAGNPLLFLKYKFAPLYDATVRNLPLKTYSLGQIRNLLNEVGLEIVSLNYLGAACKKWAPVILVEARKG